VTDGPVDPTAATPDGGDNPTEPPAPPPRPPALGTAEPGPEDETPAASAVEPGETESPAAGGPPGAAPEEAPAAADSAGEKPEDETPAAAAVVAGETESPTASAEPEAAGPGESETPPAQPGAAQVPEAEFEPETPGGDPESPDEAEVIAEAEELTEEAAGEKPAVAMTPLPTPAAGSGGSEPPKKPGITIGALTKPKGGPLAVVTRVGMLVVAIILVIALVYAGIAAINGLRGKNHVNATNSPTPTPTASPGGETYYSYSDAQHQYSFERPSDWTVRVLAGVTDTADTLAIGPPSPYPVSDLVAIQIQPLQTPVSPSDLIPFKNAIEANYIGSDATLVSQAPTVVPGGMVGYTFEWSAPAANPIALHAAYFLLDTDRLIIIQLQVEPASDTTSFLALSPIFSHIASTFLSSHVPTSTPAAPTATATAGATPTSSASP
jgi:hypothetical protein